MTRDQRKDLLEGIGFDAIIASLIFVGIETRNSTKQAMLTTQALEIAAYQELMSNIEDLNTLVLQDDDVTEVMKGFWDDAEDSHQFRERRAFFLLLRHGDLAYYMYQRGAIDESRLRSSLGPINFQNELIRSYWQEYRAIFSADFRNYVCLLYTSPSPRD